MVDDEEQVTQDEEVTQPVSESDSFNEAAPLFDEENDVEQEERNLFLEPIQTPASTSTFSSPTPVSSRLRRECNAFISYRWKWLICLLFGVFAPLVWLGASPLLLWCALNMCGYTYVSGATLERRDLLSSRHLADGYRQFTKLMLATVPLFVLAPYWTLLDPRKPGPVILLDGVFGQVYANADATFANYLCYTYLGYVIPFFVGLHFTYLDFVPFLQRLVLTAEALRRLSAAHWVLISVLLGLLLIIAAYHLQLLFAADLLWWYLGAVLLSAALLVGYHVYQRRRPGGRSFHLHHSQLVVAIALLTPFQNLISATVQAVLFGVYVEGVARWGMSSCWQ